VQLFQHHGYEIEMTPEGHIVSLRRISSRSEHVSARLWVGREEAHHLDLILARLEWNVRQALEELDRMMSNEYDAS
jgi:hypothetical protein